MTNLDPALRVAVTGLAVATAFAFHRAVFRDAAPELRRRAGLVLGAIVAVAVLASHAGAAGDLLARIIPLGLFGGLGLGIATLFLPRVRSGFDRLRDGDIRLLVGTRAGFGAILIAFAALGVLPESFALSAGLGDLLVACLAIGAPSTLDRSGSRAVRALVHGVGLLDMAMVVAEAMLVVRPFALAHPGLVTSMTLPWVAVPLVITIDLHGLRKVVGDGSEPARDVRSALS